MSEEDPTVLVLGATRKTGSRVAADLIKRGMSVRTAARSGADVDFDWGRRESYAPALKAVDRLYLVAPIMRLDFAEDVSRFLDEAEVAEVRHVTFLSAYGMEHAPDDVATRSVELDLLGRRQFGHTILRPAWFMQNFSETFLKPIDGTIANGTPAEYGAVLRQLTETIASGNGSRPNDTVERVTGTPSRTFRDFARKNAAAWEEASI
jgi:uncharacterized protein YbjT (DUF2867 family)